ncbi:undecaprenyl diphosphate synthase family protein [Oceanobacillus neutriphilus]|uniref:undecaprenyl diphosphate synthase family protein n=1 Tax=Oceanobacillus neutriphilus TaxID=531815 RepID=UPI001668969F
MNSHLYGFSTENWKRPIKEVNYLMQLFVKFLLEWSRKRWKIIYVSIILVI